MTEEKKSPSKEVHLTFTERVGISENISTISGSINQAYSELKATFDVNQVNLAQQTKLDQNVQLLKQMADSLEQSVKLSKEQRDIAVRERDDAVQEAKHQRWLAYLGIGIAFVSVVVTIILAFI